MGHAQPGMDSRLRGNDGVGHPQPGMGSRLRGNDGVRFGFTHFVKDLTNTIRFGVLCEIAQSERVAHRQHSDGFLSVLLKSVGFHNLCP